MTKSSERFNVSFERLDNFAHIAAAIGLIASRGSITQAQEDGNVPTETRPGVPEFVSIFAEPKEEILEDRIKAGLSVPEYIRESEDWTFNPDAMTWEHVNESGEVVRYRPHMGDRALEDEEFSQHFRETAAFEVLDDNGKVEWRLSFEVSSEDSFAENLLLSPDLVTNYGMTAEEFASELRSLLEKETPFLKKHGINNIIVSFRTGARHMNPGSVIPGYNNTFQYPVQSGWSTGIKVYEESGTAVISVALSSVQNHRVGQVSPFMVMSSVAIGVRVGQGLDEGLTSADILRRDSNGGYGPLLKKIWTLGGNNQFSWTDAVNPDHLDNILMMTEK